MSMPSLTGRRILAVGAGLATLAEGPLYGAVLETAGVERLRAFGPEVADLVLIDADSTEPEALVPALAALAALPSPPPTLLIGARLSAGLVRALLKLERSDVLEAPFTPDQLTRAVMSLLTAPASAVGAAAPASSSRCWAITGAVGGSGATTVAIEVAYALSQRSRKERSVCLVDLNLADGAAAAYLGATPALRLAEFGAHAERMDASMLPAFAVPVTKQLDLLACPRDPEGFDLVPREAVLRILEIACEAYDWVVVDIPRHRRPWTVDVLAGSDEVLVVSELTVPALIAARSLSEEIERRLPEGPTPRIVLNRLATRMFGPAPTMAEAERALQRKAEAGVSSDWEAAAASVNLGGPIAQHRPKSRIVRDVSVLVDRLIADEKRRKAQAARAA
ncbi:CpaE family protein [Phenylobacterium terrae]|uniref:CpaE family protein n=1 Tax=Phenylobacterium terrae TaxID=2665495 RepID=A0ABW4N297_9CAUL